MGEVSHENAVNREYLRMQVVYSELAESLGCTANTVAWVSSGISELSERKRRAGGTSESFHSSAKEVCLALLRDVNGMCAEPVGEALQCLGIPTSERIGRIVYGLIEKGLLQASDSDSEDDFKGLFDLETIDVFLRENGIRKPWFSLYHRYRQLMWSCYGVGCTVVVGSYFFDIDRSLAMAGWVLGMIGFFMQFVTPPKPRRF